MPMLFIYSLVVTNKKIIRILFCSKHKIMLHVNRQLLLLLLLLQLHKIKDLPPSGKVPRLEVIRMERCLRNFSVWWASKMLAQVSKFILKFSKSSIFLKSSLKFCHKSSKMFGKLINFFQSITTVSSEFFEINV